MASNDKMFIGIRSLWKVRQLTEKLKWGEDTGSIVTAQAYNFKERSYNCKKRLIARHVCLPACLSVCLSVCPSVYLSVCPSVCPYGTTQLSLDGFSWNLISEYFYENLSRNLEFTLKSDKNNGYFTWRTVYIYDSIVPNYSQNEKCCGEIQNTHFMLSNFFLKNLAVYEIMWKNTVEPDRSQITI